MKIYETIDYINQLKLTREFYASFAENPQAFIAKWIVSQSRDLKLVTDSTGNPERERHSDTFNQVREGDLFSLAGVDLRDAVARFIYDSVDASVFSPTGYSHLPVIFFLLLAH